MIRAAKTAAAIAAFGALYLLLGTSPLLESIELVVHDSMLRLRPKLHGSQRVTVVGATEEDIQNLAQWPMSDGEVARIVGVLMRMNPRAVGIDLYRDLPSPPGHEDLARAFADHPNIVGVMKAGDDNFPGIPAPHVLTDRSQAGFNDIAVDCDGVVRRGLLFLGDNGVNEHTFSMLLATIYLEADGIQAGPAASGPDHVSLGKAVFKPLERVAGGYAALDPRGYQYLLDYRLDPSSISTYTLGDLNSGSIPDEAVRGRIIVLGALAESVKDVFHSPVVNRRNNTRQASGVALHAMMADQILRCALDGDPLPVGLSLWIQALLAGLAGLAVLNGVNWPVRAVPSAILGLTLVAMIGPSAFLLFLKGLWIPVFRLTMVGAAALMAGLVARAAVVEPATRRNAVTGAKETPGDSTAVAVRVLNHGTRDNETAESLNTEILAAAEARSAVSSGVEGEVARVVIGPAGLFDFLSDLHEIFTRLNIRALSEDLPELDFKIGLATGPRGPALATASWLALAPTGNMARKGLFEAHADEITLELLGPERAAAIGQVEFCDGVIHCRVPCHKIELRLRPAGPTGTGKGT